MSRIIICRHGNTFDKGDIVTRVGARTDLPLSSSGRVQAQALCTHFNPDTSGFDFKIAYCSPLIRTRETADAILKGGHSATTPETLEFLTEVDYGPDENKPEAEVIARIGMSALEAWDQDAQVPDGWNVDPDAIIESWRTFLDAHPADAPDTLLVTSNGVARFVLQAITPRPDITDIKLKTGAFGLLEKSKDGTVIKRWNQRP